MSTVVQICKRCGTTYYGDEVQAMFQRGNYGKYTSHKTICNPCLLTARTEAKEACRFLSKARGTIKHHATKWAKANDPGQRWVASAAELIDRFLWDEKRIAREMERAWEHGTCDDCEKRFQDMPGGLHDLTVDIIERDEPPYWGSNTRLVCTTCNRKKSKTPSKFWGAMKAGWARWNKRQAWLRTQPKWKQSRLWDEDDEQDRSDN